jgi:hypothetical protein
VRCGWGGGGAVLARGSGLVARPVLEMRGVCKCHV